MKQTMHNSLPTLLAAFCLPAAVLAAEIPIRGLPVDELTDFDDAVLEVMVEDELLGCTVGVMKDGCVVYQRGFGWRNQNANQSMPENATMRLASVSKVLVAEAINRLIGGGLNENRHVFDLGQSGGGILDLDPWPFLQDDRMGDITVAHLRDMRVNWAADYSWDNIEIYEAMGLDPDDDYPPPPSLEDITRYALGTTMLLDPGVAKSGWPNGFDPPFGGSDYPYANLNYNILILVIEAETGQSFYSYLRQNILTANMWVPSTDLFPGKSFLVDAGPREPYYRSDASWPNVYDPSWPNVPAPYGGFNAEAMLGSSFVVASVAPMLTFSDLYPTRWIGNMAGSSARILTSTNDPDVHIAVLCNDTSPSGFAADKIAQAIDGVIGNGVTWPTTCVDGQWVDWLAAIPLMGEGSFDFPYGSVPLALTNVTGGTKLQFRPGSHPFAGVINKKLLLKAPLGAAEIGTNGL
jgi:CubicO group peptidase (beta-lactamase class C family)